MSARPTDTEEKVTKLWLLGLNRKQIAERLGLGVGHVSNVLSRLRLTTISQQRHQYDGVATSFSKGGNAFARIASRT